MGTDLPSGHVVQIQQIHLIFRLMKTRFLTNLPSAVEFFSISGAAKMPMGGHRRGVEALEQANRHAGMSGWFGGL